MNIRTVYFVCNQTTLLFIATLILLMNPKISWGYDASEQLAHAVMNRNLSEVERLLNDSPIHVNTKYNNRTPPLSYAATFGSVDIVKVLLSKGADPLQINANGETALDLAYKHKVSHLHASKENYEEIVKILLPLTMRKKKVGEARLPSKPLDSPDGLYIVNSTGVKKISTEGVKDKDGDYNIKIHEIKSIYTEGLGRKDKLVGKGWWYPSMQQFNIQSYVIPMTDTHCSSWGSKSWGFKYTPAKINISGKEVNGYKQINSYVRGSKPKPICVHAGIKKRTCERVRCNKWEQAKPRNYLVKNKANALNLFQQLAK